MPSTSKPKINTYHCHCTTLLITTTHTLSSLPTRHPSSSSSSSKDIILPLPLPSSPPTTSSPPLPTKGTTHLTSLHPDPKTTIIRKEDGFEPRILYRCERCRLVVGYTIPSLPSPSLGAAMDIDGDDDNGGEKEGEERGYEGKVIYLLPGGLVNSEFMRLMGRGDKDKDEEGKKKRIREEDVEIGIANGGSRGIAVFE